MTITKEREILDFNPVNPGEDDERARPFVDLGVVYPGIHLVYGVFPYQKRNVYIEGEPFAGDLTEQPTLAFVNGKGFRTLAYLTDIDIVKTSYGEEIVNQVLARIREHTSPSVDPWEGHDDF